MSHPKRKGKGRPKRSSEISLEGCRKLERGTDVPLYYQLGAVLFEGLETGPWREGARFPTERELEEHFEVSRVVVRRALDLLEGDGAITRRQGAGAFVAPRRRSMSAFGLIEALAGRKEKANLRVFSARGEEPDSPVAKLLRLDGSETLIFHVVAALEQNGKPIGLIDSHTSTGRVPWVLEAVRDRSTPVPSPDNHGVTLTRSDVFVEHTYFGNWGGPRLGQSAGDPAWMIRLVQYGTPQGGEGEVPLEFARIFYPARTTKLHLALKR